MKYNDAKGDVAWMALEGGIMNRLVCKYSRVESLVEKGLRTSVVYRRVGLVPRNPHGIVL